MTKAAVKHHIRTAGSDRCPYCKADFGGGMIDGVQECGDLDPVENGDIEQISKCLKCGRRWMDVFRLVEVREICN